MTATNTRYRDTELHRPPAEPEPAGPAGSAARRSGSMHRFRRGLPRAIHLLFIAGLAGYFLGPKFDSARRSIGLLSHVDRFWLAVALVAELLSLLTFALGTRVLLPPNGNRLPLWRVIRIDLSTIALSHAVPAGSAAGTALGYRLLTTSGVPPVEAGFAKVSQSLLSGVILQLLLWSALAISIPLHGSSPVYLAATVAGVVVVAVLVLLGVLLIRHAPALQRGVARLADRLPRVSGEAAGRMVGAVAEQLRELLRSPRRLAWASIWATANWAFDALCLWCCLRAFGYAAGYDELMVAFALASVLASLPVAPSGLGIVEGALVPTLVGLGAPGTVALLGVLAWRLLNFWLPLPLGAAAYLALPTGRLRIPLELPERSPVS